LPLLRERSDGGRRRQQLGLVQLLKRLNAASLKPRRPWQPVRLWPQKTTLLLLLLRQEPSQLLL
jgi:hypothetical protein